MHGLKQRTSDRFSRITLAFAAGLMALSLSSCGGSDATFEAVVVIPTEDATWTLNDNAGGGSISPAGGIQIQVHRSSTDSTPVPGANVDVVVAGTAINNAHLFDPTSGAQLDTAGVFQTQANEFGIVNVDPVANLNNCPPLAAGETASITGNISVIAYISRDTTIWNGSFTFTCKG